MIFNTRDLVKSDSSHFSNNFKRLVLREQDYFTSSIKFIMNSPKGTQVSVEGGIQ